MLRTRLSIILDSKVFNTFNLLENGKLSFFRIWQVWGLRLLIILPGLLNICLRLFDSLRGLLKMAMLMNQMVPSTLIFNLIGKSLSMANLKELLKPKLRLKKLMKRNRKEIKRISHYGRLRNLESLFGSLNGDPVDLAGILSAQQWLQKSLAPKSIFTLEELI